MLTHLDLKIYNPMYLIPDGLELDTLHLGTKGINTGHTWVLYTGETKKPRFPIVDVHSPRREGSETRSSY